MNKFLRYNSVIVVLVCILFFCSVKSSYAQDDLENWNSVTINYKLTDKLYFAWLPQVRIKDDISDFYYFETVQGFKYKYNKNLELGLYHLYAEEDKSSGSTDKENRARIEVTLKKKMGEFKFSDRNRYEYRDINGKGKTRYRNRIKIEKDVTLWGHTH